MEEIPAIKINGSNGNNKGRRNDLEIPHINIKDKETNAKISTLANKFMKKIKFWKNMTNRQKKALKITGVIFGLIFLFTMVLFADLFIRGLKFGKAARGVLTEIENKNIDGTKEELVKTSDALASFKNSFSHISFLKFVPFFGKFIDDGTHGINAAEYGLNAFEIVVDEMKVMGIGIENTTNPTSSTQDKIDFGLATVPAVISKYDEIGDQLVSAEIEIANIDPNDYPKSIFGKKVRENVNDLVVLSETLNELYPKSKSLVSVLPYLLGAEEERTYMIIFQNDMEIRPTGGFITAYSIAKVHRGKFEPVGSYDIYDLDEKYEPRIDAPEPLIKYLKGPYEQTDKFLIRDLNWSPDFSQSMQLFLEEAKQTGVDNIDGVISIDTRVLVNLLGVIGEIQVPGYGGYSNNIVPLCDCEQIIYELEHFADREGPIVWSENEPGKIVHAPENYLDRKKILGPMMDAMVSNLLGLPSSKMPELINATYKSIKTKHILGYMVDERVQSALDDFGMTGTIENFDGDYLFINAANFGGKKANLYVTEEIDQGLEIDSDGTVVKKLKITYKNPKPQDNWLNSILPQYVRIYVPADSELLSSSGLEDQPEPYEEFGKEVFAGYMQVRPLGISQVVVEYKLPQKFDNGKYSLYIQKQPGTKDVIYRINLNGKSREFKLDSDKIVEINI
jgi:hypothetical protein